MAEISSAQALPPGHLQSPLFKLIPTESAADAVFCFTNRHLGFLKYQLLLTCKQIYDEALAVYWSETIVCNGEGYFSRGLFFERIPDFAKLHIKHLRDVQTGVNPGVKSLRDIAFSRQASLAEAIDAFPKLQTCSVMDGDREDAREMKPSKAVEEALVRHPKIHFLKTLPVKEGDDGWDYKERKLLERIYIDFTTDRACFVEEDTWNRFPRIDDEEGFQLVMKLESSETASDNGEA